MHGPVRAALLALGLATFAVQTLAISACSGGRWNNLGLDIDLRVKDKKVAAVYVDDLDEFNQPYTVGKRDCESRTPKAKNYIRKPVVALTKKNYKTAPGMTTVASRGLTKTFTCDHILELNILKSVMEAPDGACDKAAAIVAATPSKMGAVRQSLMDIRRQGNNNNNLAFHEGSASPLHRGSAEDYKTDSVADWHNAQDSLTHILPGTIWQIAGLEGYLTAERSLTLTVASFMDQRIAAGFPGAVTGVEDKWKNFITVVKNSRTAAEKAELKRLNAEEKKKLAEAAQNKLNAENCATGPAGPSTGPGTGPPPPPPTQVRMVRRHASADGFSLWPAASFSSLTRRAARAPRSGPKAPAAPCCPRKNQPQKQVIPRSKVAVKPAPATRPRQATQRPAPRTPARPRQVAKRPAARAQRKPGQPAPNKRASPKQKPKKVPRPTRRPKGTPRNRRRGRK